MLFSPICWLSRNVSYTFTSHGRILAFLVVPFLEVPAWNIKMLCIRMHRLWDFLRGFQSNNSFIILKILDHLQLQASLLCLLQDMLVQCQLHMIATHWVQPRKEQFLHLQGTQCHCMLCRYSLKVDREGDVDATLEIDTAENASNFVMEFRILSLLNRSLFPPNFDQRWAAGTWRTYWFALSFVCPGSSPINSARQSQELKLNHVFVLPASRKVKT